VLRAGAWSRPFFCFAGKVQESVQPSRLDNLDINVLLRFQSLKQFGLGELGQLKNFTRLMTVTITLTSHSFSGLKHAGCH
jgi:hypothetical protein